MATAVSHSSAVPVKIARDASMVSVSPKTSASVTSRVKTIPTGVTPTKLLPVSNPLVHKSEVVEVKPTSCVIGTTDFAETALNVIVTAAAGFTASLSEQTIIVVA